MWGVWGVRRDETGLCKHIFTAYCLFLYAEKILFFGNKTQKSDQNSEMFDF